MNKISPPIVDDLLALQSLANNQAVASYPKLKRQTKKIQQGYLAYKVAFGNPLVMPNASIPDEIADYLKAHYKSPPRDLKHIKELRTAAEHRMCPMCGSLHRGTLDHLLPQSSYPIFSVYSLNLVPACKCNMKRQEVLIGPIPGERILHPYFDDCLSDRLISAHFEDLGAVPRVELRLLVDETHIDYRAIDFHFRSIVKRTAVIGYLRERWIDLCRKPSLVIRGLKKNPATRQALSRVLSEELAMLDDIHQGKNNWNSIFVSGLSVPSVRNWIFTKMTSLVRNPDGPLV